MSNIRRDRQRSGLRCASTASHLRPQLRTTISSLPPVICAPHRKLLLPPHQMLVVPDSTPAPSQALSNPEGSQTSCCISHTPYDLLDMLCRRGPASAAHSRRPARNLGKDSASVTQCCASGEATRIYLSISPQSDWQLCSRFLCRW